LSLSTVKDAAEVAPKSTAVMPLKPEPWIVTVDPPAIGPEFGVTTEMVGIRPYRNRSASVVPEIPPAVTTVTSTHPVSDTGLVAVIRLSLTTAKVLAGFAPNATAVAPVNPLPWIDMDAPPVVEPAGGLIDEITGLDT
jgi:hypothetical protein